MKSELLFAILRQRGIASSAELQRELGKSQPTLSRLLRASAAGIVRLGQGKSARYALPELIWGLPAQQPLMFDQAPWGTLTFISGNRVHVAGSGIDVVAHGELPWFLDNFRLNGFLGRAWARQLGFDADPENWLLAQLLYANCQFAFDPPGAISIGEKTGLTINRVSADSVAKAVAYDLLADDVATTLPAGSSAGGEQPKFLVVEDNAGNEADIRHLIVKFSPPRGTPFGERWHDLLWAEALALEVLASNGIAAAQAGVVQSERRTYLESPRFDRSHAGRKVHVVPLAAAHREFVPGPRRNWAETCDALAAQRRLPREDADTARVLLEYGRLIGNTDMHFGNLSLFAPDPSSGRFTLAPAYDMLPMCYRPDMHKGDIDYMPLTPNPVGRGREPERAQARELALRFWGRVADARNVSAAFREVAARNHAALNP